MEKQVIIQEQIISPPKYTGPIIINVENPEFVDKQPFGFYTYSIVGSDMNGLFQVRRRYRDFDRLRRTLVQRWLGTYIPPISGKRAQNNPLYLLKIFETDNKEERYAFSRLKFLKYFCAGIAARPYLFYCDLFQIFLRGGPNYQMAIQACISKQYSFLLNCYETSFVDLITFSSQVELAALIATNDLHLAALKKSEKILQDICGQIFKATKSRDDFNLQFNVCMGTVFPEYEQKFLMNHINQQRERLILNRNQQFNVKLTQFKLITAANPLENFFQLIMFEIRQTKAFIEAIQCRKTAESYKIGLQSQIQAEIRQKTRITNGEFSFKYLFKTGSKQLKLNEIQMKIEILQYELICLEKMFRIMLININYEIEQFRLRRGKEYASLFRNVAEKELIQLNAYNQLLKVPLLALE